MLLDQQFPIERAFIAPFRLQQRLKQTLEAKTIASLSSDAMLEIFTEKTCSAQIPEINGGAHARTVRLHHQIL